LNLNCDFLVSEFAFTFNLYRYSKGRLAFHIHHELGIRCTVIDPGHPGWGCTS
jgi:hypothetical protein